MRKLIVSVNITLDGFMSGLNCGLDWHFQHWNDEMSKYATEQLRDADTILLGRVTYKAMSGYWPSVTINMSYPRQDIVFADMMNNYHKIVFSKTLKKTEWNNSRLVQKNIRKEIVQLKQQPGKNIIIYGSGSIISTFSQWALIDEYELWVHPVILGKGRPLFRDLPNKPKLKLLKTKTFNSSVVILSYQAIK